MKNIPQPISEVTDHIPPMPIFIPDTEIMPLQRAASVKKHGGKVKIEPREGKQLNGFRCPYILDSASIYEMCGKGEPMEWQGRVAVSLSSENVDQSLFADFEKDYTGEMKPVPINCLALYPESDSYIVCGFFHTRFLFRMSGAWLDERAIIELSAYQPLPHLIYEGSVVVEDCDEPELLKRLKDLIKK